MIPSLFVFFVGVLMVASPLLDILRRFGDLSQESFDRYFFETPLPKIYFFRLQMLTGTFFVGWSVCLNLARGLK